MNEVLRWPFIRYGAIIFIAALASALMFPGGLPRLFSSNEFLPHSTCYLRNPELIRLHVITDMLIGLAYVSISSTLGYLVWRASKDIPFHWMFLAFGIFIISCGFTHFMEVWTVWKSVYWLAGYVKLITATASVVTAIALFPLVPKIFALIAAVKVSEERRVRLEQAHAELEKSNYELSEQKAQLESANRELEMFTYTVAHDLRAPLRSMRSFAEILNSDYATKLDAEGRSYGARIMAGSERMTIMLNDLLSYSQINRSNIELKSISLSNAVQEVLATFAEEITRTGARIEANLRNQSVQADPTLLTLALTNLIGNALKYVPPDRKPQIRVTLQSAGKRVRVYIEDNGIGIEPKYYKTVFNLFERLAPDYPGTGMGLTIARRAIERMRGDIGVEPNSPLGTRFWIELPAAEVLDQTAPTNH